MHRIFLILSGIFIIASIIGSTLFIVREQNYALVFSLGELRREISDPGLYFKLPSPFQNIVFLDKRVLTIESKDAERIQTSEKKNLLIDSFVKWKIANPRLFYVTFEGNERAAQERLQAQIRDALNASVNIRTVKEVVSVERAKIMAEILNNVANRASPLGVEIVDVRLRHIEFAPEISKSVYMRMEAERTRVANELRSIGAAESEKIRAEADRHREEILAKANVKAQEIMGDADASASAIYSSSYTKNKEFYKFYKSIDAYRASFSTKNDVMIVDPSSEFFQFIKRSSIKE
ncbi:membrane protease subunit HflC [Candidatus Kinetoplastibacterium blastocrithidii TCC012E]|uniref:Protein HflC n=1 Tax=Candidatus Kinetoplastidibacterium blastocrithidiae TCC012E TaxID=1208922 RepID=M1M3X8_9PROT|nr:protease modulator HflC [Candidatus Kinetoplastibacterium blastocrithidii]AFZ83692.1 HflC protein [Candidatus Kinetoplastibacterium blastocrithidii (ex Strigomonas culicis)]AGF49814.1 membrane protease subunit HflC [Candidatus Kinetoplastibacterium blastocrithidii TCC012E]